MDDDVKKLSYDDFRYYYSFFDQEAENSQNQTFIQTIKQKHNDDIIDEEESDIASFMHESEDKEV